MRRSLYLKDDDYRLSFLYGNFTTLTRFTELDARADPDRAARPAVRLHPRHRPRRSGPRMLRNPQGRHQPALAEVLLDGGHRGARPDRRLPRGQRRGLRSRTPWPASSTATRHWPRVACRAPRGQPVLQRARDAAAHHGTRPRAVIDTVDEWQRLFRSALGRRMVFAADEYYLLAERDLPPGSALRRVPPARERHRAWPAPSWRPSRGPGPTARVGCATGSSPRSTPHPPRATGRRRLPVGPAEARRAGPVTVLTGDLRRPGARSAAGLPPAGRRRASSRAPTTSSAGNIGVAGLLTGEDLAARPRRRARRAALPAPRRLPERGPIPRRPDPGRPAPARRGGAHRRARSLRARTRRARRFRPTCAA